MRVPARSRSKVVVMVRRALTAAFVLAALLVSVAGAACPPMAAVCPMHASSVGCAATAPGEPDNCCPGTASSESSPFQARLLRPLHTASAMAELNFDLQPFSEASPLELQSCVAAVPADLNSLFCVFLI